MRRVGILKGTCVTHVLHHCPRAQTGAIIAHVRVYSSYLKFVMQLGAV